MRPVLITGANGMLGRGFLDACRVRGLLARGTGRRELDIADPESVRRALDRNQPWLLVNAAGYVHIDEAEREAARCHRENVIGPQVLAAACARDNVALLVFSSDLVFDGRKGAAYEERDMPAPLGVYGRTKYEAEVRVRSVNDDALVIRTSALFGSDGPADFVATTRRELAAGRTVRAASDLTVSPTYIPDLVHASLDLAIDGEFGIWHLANAGAVSWAELARLVAIADGHDRDRVVGVPVAALGWVAPRPRFSALGSSRGRLLPALDDALHRSVGQRPTACFASLR